MIAALEWQLNQAIIGIRSAARASALQFSYAHFGAGIQPTGLAGAIEDARRAREYSGNLGTLGLDTLREGKPLIRALDNRLITIGITENSHAYNHEHRSAVINVAAKFNLIEVWDSTLDAGTCEVCWHMDGEEAIDGRFEHGLVPGGVHARCRCTSHFLRRQWLN